jgi:hypothetical protein
MPIHDPDTFHLEPPPVGVRARVLASIKAERDLCDRIARRQPDHEAFMARAYFITHGFDLVEVHDPLEDGATLATVVASVARRIATASEPDAAPRARWWLRDLAVWHAGRLAAVVRPDRRGGTPVVTTFADDRLYQ